MASFFEEVSKENTAVKVPNKMIGDFDGSVLRVTYQAFVQNYFVRVMSVKGTRKSKSRVID